jgi:hypothetical protein
MKTIDDLMRVRAANERAVLRAARKYAMLKLLNIIVDEDDCTTQPDPQTISDLLKIFSDKLYREAENLVKMEVSYLSLVEAPK